ncbi:helix-turn-helix transcriptional regulator [Actinomadura flavalba]|uniref:helix-turn-helix transcriptional regulator n=1 Tax=Actinomadura flavalba TaxID=1120938 RepID=UPI0003618C48|nr:AAA family ATPase [Actinomadura flavalba]
MNAPLVGRAAELALLRDALDAAPGGVLVGGEAGLGKTRLLREFTAGLGDGHRVLVGGCLELGSGGLPYAPFSTILRGLVRDIGVDGVTALLPRGDTSGLARLLPEFGEPETDTASGEERARLFELVLTLLEGLAARGPVVVVIEDAHWADRSSRDLLSFLLRNLGTAPLLVLVTYRADELHRGHPLRPLLAELGRVEGVRRLDLTRLTQPDVAELAAGLLGRPLDRDLAGRITTRSEGNPLFVEALLEADGTLVCELPESLRDLLLAGVERLPEETQEVLRDAAGGGTRLEHRLLSAVTGLDDRDLTRALRPAVAANVLVVDGDGYAFRHALIREALHDDLLPGEHTRLHTRYAKALEDDGTLVPARRLWAELSHHWTAAHDAPWALVSSWRAAHEARKAAAYAECLTMLERVLELWDRVPDAAARLGTDQADVLGRAAHAAELAGELERGLKLTDAALVRVGGAPERRAGLLVLRGGLRHQLARPGFIEDLREAVEVLPDEPTKLRAHALSILAQYGRLTTGIEEARRHARESLRIARRIGDAGGETHALTTLFCVDIEYGAHFERIEEVRRAVERNAQPSAVLRLAVIESHYLEGLGRHADAVAAAARGYEQAREFGLARTQGTFLAINKGEPLLSLGRFDEALTVTRQALDQDPPITIRTSLLVLDGLLALYRGDVATARRRIADTDGIASFTQRWPKTQDYFAALRLKGETLFAEGRYAEALASAGPVLDLPGLPDDARYAWPVLTLAARAVTALDDDVETLLRPLEKRAIDTDVRGPVQEAWSALFRAETGYARGERDCAAFDAVAAAWDALDQPYDRALALERAARCALAAGGAEAAAERVATATAISRELGAAPLTDRLAGLAPRSRSTAPLGLTPREYEVLRLLADGGSNRAIAADLHISAKTASVHVSNILAKIGAATRGEAAAKAHRLGLF